MVQACCQRHFWFWSYDKMDFHQLLLIGSSKPWNVTMTFSYFMYAMPCNSKKNKKYRHYLHYWVLLDKDHFGLDLFVLSFFHFKSSGKTSRRFLSICEENYIFCKMILFEYHCWHTEKPLVKTSAVILTDPEKALWETSFRCLAL